MADEFEVPIVQQMSDIALVASEKIVQSQHVMALLDELLTEERAEKTRATSD
jgi:hypothetical protein